MSDVSESQKKERRPRNPAGTILRVKKTVKTRRGEKEIEELYARLRRTGADGKPREKKRKINSATEAAAMWRTLEAEFEEEKKKAERDAAKDGKTFADLVNYYEREFVKDAVWREGQVVEGYRNPLRNIRHALKVLKAEFGSKPLAAMGYEDVRTFRQTRLDTPVVVNYKKRVPVSKENRSPRSRKQFDLVPATRTRPRKIASVNRELALLRHLFNIGIRLGWMNVNPFKQGAPLIIQSAETERMRILNSEEQERLISVCTGAREHLRAVIIFALETAMRKGEILHVKWRDVDFQNNVIYAEGKNTKTLKPRIVPLTQRLRVELERLKQTSRPKHAEETIFLNHDFKRSFATACRLAGLSDFRFHDLRHTATTRIDKLAGNTSRGMKITGHTQIKTYQRYINVDVEIAREIGAAMDAESAQIKTSAPTSAPKVLEMQSFLAKKKANK